MEGIFKETKRFDSDFYVGDYTQYAETHADCQYSGVTISDVSLPEHDDLIPFSQFYPSPERILEYKEKLHVNLISSNVIEIRTHQHVRIED